MSVKQRIVSISKEISILEVTQHSKVQNDTEGNEEFPLGFILTLIYLFAKIEIGYSAEYQQKYEQSAGFVIEKAANKEQKQISDKDTLVYQSETYIYDNKKYPETHLSEVHGVFFGEFENIIYPIHSSF